MVDVLKKIVCVLSAIGIGLSQWLAGVYAGVSYGSIRICNHSYPSVEMAGVTYWMSHGDPYMELSALCVHLSVALLALILMMAFRTSRVIGAITVVSLAVCIIWWFRMNEIIRVTVGDPDKYIDLMRDTVYAHWALGVTIGAILVLSIAVMFRPDPRESGGPDLV